MWDWFVKNWLGWAIGLIQAGIAALFGWLWRREKRQRKELIDRLDTMESRLQVSEEIDRLTLYRYIDADFEMCMERGWISINRCNVLQKMADRFKAIDGDDPAVDHMMQQLRKLPHKARKEYYD